MMMVHAQITLKRGTARLRPWQERPTWIFLKWLNYSRQNNLIWKPAFSRQGPSRKRKDGRIKKIEEIIFLDTQYLHWLTYKYWHTIEGVDEKGTRYTPLQMTWASPLSEVYTTDKVSYVCKILFERGGNYTSFTASHVFRDRMVSETVWFPKKSK